MALTHPPGRHMWRSPYLLLTFTMLFWASNAVMARALHDLLPPVAMAFWRWVLAAVLLSPFVLRPMYRQRALLRANLARLVLLAALGIASYNTFLYAALQTTTATNGVLINSVTPLMIAFLGWLLFNVELGSKQQLGIVLSLAGMAVIVSRADVAVLADLDFNRGDFLLIGGALSWALYTVFLRWRPPGIGAAAFLGSTIMIGAALLLPPYLIEAASGRVAVWNGASIGGIAYFAVFPSVLGYLFWNRGVQQVGPNRAALFLYLIPVFGVALAVTFLGERLHLFHLAGAALIFTGIYLATARATAAQG